jgi:hypothetical protein
LHEQKIKSRPPSSEPKYITTTTSGVSDSNSQDVIFEGNYSIIGGELSIVDRNGNPKRDNRGKMYTRQLTDQELNNPRQTAGSLLRDYYHAMNAGKTDFNRPLVYSNLRIV